MIISMPSSLTSPLSNICASIFLPPGLLRDKDMHSGQQSGLNNELEAITRNTLLGYSTYVIQSKISMPSCLPEYCNNNL